MISTVCQSVASPGTALLKEDVFMSFELPMIQGTSWETMKKAMDMPNSDNLELNHPWIGNFWYQMRRWSVRWSAFRVGVLFLTQAWVLLKQKFTQGHIYQDVDFCLIVTLIWQGSRYLLWSWTCFKQSCHIMKIFSRVDFHLSNTQTWVRNSTPPKIKPGSDRVMHVISSFSNVRQLAIGLLQKWWQAFQSKQDLSSTKLHFNFCTNFWHFAQPWIC